MINAQQVGGDGGILRIDEIQEIVGRIQYKDWRFIVRPLGDELVPPGPEPRQIYVFGRCVLRIEFDAPDAYSPDHKPVKQYGRPWLLEPRSASELLQTVWLATTTVEEHEARELFTYEGRRIFNPHKNHQLGIPV